MDTILLINDSTTLTKVLTEHFQTGGFKVISVSGAVMAYEAFIRNEVPLILIDFVLKDQDGLSVIKTFRANKSNQDLPIVVFTSLEDQAIFKQCMDAGANLILPKSQETGSMLVEIENLIDEYKSKLPSCSIDSDMGGCIVKATTDVFKTMMNMKVVPGEVSVEKAQSRKAEVIGSIGVAGFLSGSISIFLSHAMAMQASANMLMMEDPCEVSEEDMVDAIGELTNMIGGNIKNELFEKTALFDISVPSVYVGQDLHRRTVSNDLCFHVPFTWEGMELSVEFLMITAESASTTGVQATIMASLKG